MFQSEVGFFCFQIPALNLPLHKGSPTNHLAALLSIVPEVSHGKLPQGAAKGFNAAFQVPRIFMNCGFPDMGDPGKIPSING